jgi:hypothetical protein
MNGEGYGWEEREINKQINSDCLFLIEWKEYIHYSSNKKKMLKYLLHWTQKLVHNS